MHKNGYNIFAMAPSGTGKLTTVRQLVEHEASRQCIPSDWCYVNNFSQPAKPTAIKFMPGHGKVFKQDMEQLIEELSIAIPAAFDGDEYRSRTGELESESRRREISELSQLREEAANAHIFSRKPRPVTPFRRRMKIMKLSAPSSLISLIRTSSMKYKKPFSTCRSGWQNC